GYNEFIKIRWADYNKGLKEKKAATKAANTAAAAAAAAVDPTAATTSNDDDESKLAAVVAKEPAVVPQEVMSGFAKEWKAMSEANKAKYKSEAQLKNAAKQLGTGSAKKQLDKPLTDYQYFIRNFDRSQHPEVNSKDLMKIKAK